MGDLNTLTGKIVASAVRIHRALGPGLFESVYETVLARDLTDAGLRVEVQKPIPIRFENLYFENAFRADLVIEEALIIEIKSLTALAPIHEKQLLTYLRLLDYRVGLLLNFGAPMMRQGIKRIVNRL